MTSQPIDILDLLNPVEVADQADPTLQPNSEIPRFGSKDATTVIKSFSDYSGKSRTEAIAHAAHLSTDGCLYTVRATGSGSYRQTWEVCKGYFFGSLMNFHNGGEVIRPHLEAAAIATYESMFGESVVAEFLPVLTLSQFDTHVQQRANASCTGQEVIDLWYRFKQSVDVLQAELTKLKKADLARRIHWHRNDAKKEQLVRGVLDAIRDYFHPGWYGGDSHTWGHGEDIVATIDNCIHEWTDELIQAVYQKRQAEREARREYMKKATTNPETLQEFDTFFRVKGVEEAFTTELRARYEALVAQAGIESRFKTKARKATSYATGLPEGVTLSEVVETKHTRDAYDLFVVQLSERVEREVYQALETRARKLGGKYSSYNKNAAIPGFQFREREKAEQFRSLGYVDGTQRVEERLEGKMDRASDRLLEQAQTLEADANERLTTPRLENTTRRATIAENMEIQARKDLQLAGTMRNVALALAEREVQYIKNLYTRAHVEQLERILQRARWAAHREESKAERSRYSNDRELQRSDIDFALFPYPTLHKEVLICIIKTYGEKAGFKLLCQWLNRSAGKYFYEHPQENLYPFRTSKQLEQLTKLYEKLQGRWSKYTTQSDLCEIPKGRYFNQYDIERIKWAMEDWQRLTRMNITNNAELRTALREYWELRGEQTQVSALKQLMRQLVSRKIPNYHPTPDGLAERMVELLQVEVGMSVCEPSCGMFHLVDALAGEIDLNSILLTGYEIVDDLIEICRLKYPAAEYPTVQIHSQDFLRVQGKQFNRILANFPFRNPYNQGAQKDLGADIQHMMNSYTNLAPQGRIVAIMGNGAFTRSDSYAREFQQWFRSVGGEDELLPEGTFLESDRPTGASTRLVVINRS